MALTDMMSIHDPGQTSTGPMGFWNNLLSLSQRAAKPGIGGMIGNAIGGQYAPGVGYMWDMLGHGWSAPKSPIMPPSLSPLPEKQLPQGGGMGSLASLLQMFGGDVPAAGATGAAATQASIPALSSLIAMLI